MLVHIAVRPTTSLGRVDTQCSVTVHSKPTFNTSLYRNGAMNLIRTMLKFSSNVNQASPFAAHPTIDCEPKLREPQTLKAGATLILLGNITGVPTPEVAWFHDGKPISVSDTISIETGEGFTRLTIKKTTGAQAGSYKTTATNVGWNSRTGVHYYYKRCVRYLHCSCSSGGAHVQIYKRGIPATQNLEGCKS